MWSTSGIGCWCLHTTSGASTAAPRRSGWTGPLFSPSGDGKIILAEFYVDRAEALRAAGLAA